MGPLPKSLADDGPPGLLIMKRQNVEVNGLSGGEITIAFVDYKNYEEQKAYPLSLLLKQYIKSDHPFLSEQESKDSVLAALMNAHEIVRRTRVKAKAKVALGKHGLGKSMSNQGFETVSVTPKAKFRGWKPWMGTVVRAKSDGAIFVHPVLAGMSETETLLCLGYDGTPAVNIDGHLYAPLSWLVNEKPKFAETLKALAESAFPKTNP
jgi:hypothetical protein